MRVVATLRDSVEKLSQLEHQVLLVATAPDRKCISGMAGGNSLIAYALLPLPKECSYHHKGLQS